ncbi:CPBP family intramembrane metalloprotease [Gemella sp. GH3]|uniref:CPBP family intramembrane glutamic endopeptidase n=1 Tax=unclassified Gemella TaxID=2624949 RepID=UPI0015D02EB5|nr:MULTISPECIES: type II CAAX endopeptidase family protein [unclassified Gemella]MBF0713898.1 CPBP family intramembrane metalloprotease [Gemella sp. GH3.1]NYS50850.1 CPBP family intramembrane metalloprotease [Gemella sp. GH3]
MNISLKKGQFWKSIFVVSIYILFTIFLPKVILEFINLTSINSRIIVMLSSCLLATIVILVFTSKYKINSIENMTNKHGIIRTIMYGIIGFLAMMMLQMMLGISLKLISVIFGIETGSQNTSTISQIVKSVPLYSVYAIVFAPILEELVFRKAIFGYVYDIVETKSDYIRFTLAALVTGIIFSLPHDGFSPVMIVYVVMSIVFSILYKITGRILTPILAHILMNFIVLFVQVYLA